MRILYLSNSFPKISETFVINEIADLVSRGADVRVLSMWRPSDKTRSSLTEDLGLTERIYYRAQLKRGRFAEILRMALLIFHNRCKCPPPVTNEFSRYELLETAIGFSFADHWTPDLIHCHFGPVGNLGAALKNSGLTQAKLSVTFHGFDLSQVMKEKPKGFYGALFQTADRIFSINEYYLNLLQNLGAPVEKIILFHMGVDCDELGFKPRNLSDGGRIECISVGRLTEKKGFEYTIRAFAKVADARPDLDLKLNIAGDGPLMDDLQSLTDTLGMDDKIVLHGALQHGDVQSLLETSHIFLLPSVTAANGDMEGIPVALMEAIAKGMPVLSTFHSGIPELIEDHVTGFLVEEKDDAALAERLLYLIDNPEIWVAMTRAARTKIESEFNRRIQSDILYKEFMDLTS